MRETDIDGLRSALEEGVTLIDVREPQEYAEAHVPGAVLIPMGQLAGRLAEVPTDGPLYVICRTGNRSGLMGPLLDAQGYDSINVLGGTAAWVQAGLPYDQGL